MLESPELNAYRQERARQRNGARNPRFMGNGSGFGVVDRQRKRGMNALMDWANDHVPSLDKNTRLF